MRYSAITKVTAIGVVLGAPIGVLEAYAVIATMVVDPPRTPLVVVTWCALSALLNAVMFGGLVYHAARSRGR